MTIVLILVEDRLPITTILGFALVGLVPALIVDVMVLFGPDADRPHDPLSRPRTPPHRSPRRRRRRRD